MNVKRFLFKMINTLKDENGNSDKVSLNELWAKFFRMNEEQQRNETTGEAHMNSKDEMKNILQQMEADDLCLLDGDDIILTGN